MPVIEERTISGKGVLKVPDTEDVEKARTMTLFVSVFRRPINEYLNFNYNPPRGRYATLNFFRDSFLVMSVPLEFPFQSWDFYPELNYQNLYALDCVYEGILQSFVNLGTALGLTVISVDNSIALYRHTDLWFDEIKVVCYADTAVKLKLSSKPYDFCPEQPDVRPDPPPPPPVEITEVPPGTPLVDDLSVSPPYDGENDNGDTEPFITDESVPPDERPTGNACEQYDMLLTYDLRLSDGSFAPQQNTFTVFGQYALAPILVPVVGNEERTFEIQMRHQGIVAPGAPCGAYEPRLIQSFAPNGEVIQNPVISLR